ncbi:hypothetical protein IFM89_003598 [Coptis chinensis]|uniref:Uncharacterized protein n=1 Tax=Coptis chinensis TaxID=261450 RepID=A0A835HZU8_9MAGN|nr:hypothetical protein IFM89_003598 [Coptis chinensis]
MPFFGSLHIETTKIFAFDPTLRMSRVIKDRYANRLCCIPFLPIEDSSRVFEAKEDGTSHYMKGLILMLCYIIIAVSFFFAKFPVKPSNILNLGSQSSLEGTFSV